MQFEIQKFAAVTIDEAAQASGKVAGDPVVTTYTIDERDNSYSVGVADGTYTLSGGQYTVTVANSEITAVSALDGTAVEDWSTAITSGATVIVPGNADGEQVTFTIAAGEAGGYVLSANDTAITGDTTVTLTTAATDDEEATTYVITIAGGKITGVTENGEALEDYSDLEVVVPGAVSTETTNIDATSTTSVSYTTFTLQGYGTSTYAVTVDDSGAVTGLTKDGASVELTNGTFTEAGVGEVYTLAYTDGVLTATSSTDETHNLTSATEDGGITKTDTYIKATFDLSSLAEGASVEISFDPSNTNNWSLDSATGINATVNSNGKLELTTDGDNASTSIYNVTVDTEANSATITPTTDGTPQVNDIGNVDTAFNMTATFGDFEITFNTNATIKEVVYTKDTSQQVTSLGDNSFSLLSLGSATYTVEGAISGKSATVGGQTVNGYVLDGATLTTSEDGRSTVYSTTKVEDVVTLEDSELSGLTIVDGKVTSVGDATNAASLTGTAEVDSATGVVSYLGRTFTVSYNSSTNVATVTADKNAITAAAEVALVDGQDSLEARNSGEVTIDGQVYTVNVGTDNKVASVYVGSGSTGTKLEGASEIFTIGDNQYAFTYNSTSNIVNVSTSADSVTSTVASVVTPAQGEIPSGYSLAADENNIIVDATGKVLGIVDSNNLDVTSAGVSFTNSTYSLSTSSTFNVATVTAGDSTLLYTFAAGSDATLTQASLTAGASSVTSAADYNAANYYTAGASTGSGTTVFEVAGNTYTINYTYGADGKITIPGSGVNASSVSIVTADGSSVAAASLESYISNISNSTGKIGVTFGKLAGGIDTDVSIGTYSIDISNITDTAIAAGSEFAASVSGKYYNVYADSATGDSVSDTAFDGLSVTKNSEVTLIQYQYNDDLSIAYYVQASGTTLSAVTAAGAAGDVITLGSGSDTQEMVVDANTLVFAKDNSKGDSAKWVALSQGTSDGGTNFSKSLANVSFKLSDGNLVMTGSDDSKLYDGVTISAGYTDGNSNKTFDAADTITVTPSKTGGSFFLRKS